MKRFLVTLLFLLLPCFAQAQSGGWQGVYLDDLTDVSAPYDSVADGETIVWNDSLKVWENGVVTASVNGTSANLTSLIVTGNSTLQNVTATTINATTINQGGQPVVNNSTAFLGDVTGTIGATVVGDNSHAHGTTTLTVDTANVTELTNLYYTDERVDDRVSALIQNTTKISFTYSDVGGTLTPVTQDANLTPAWGNIQSIPANTTSNQSLNITDNVNFSQVNATTINQGGQPIVNNTTAFLGEVTGTIGATILTDNSSVQNIQWKTGANVYVEPKFEALNSSNVTLTLGNDTTNKNVNLTAELVNTAVTAGSYAYGNFTVDAKGRITAATTGVLPSSTPQIDNFTIVNLSQGLQVANWVIDSIATLAFYRSVDSGATKYNLPNSFMDEYEDATGVYNATGGVYNSTTDYYENNQSVTGYGSNINNYTNIWSNIANGSDYNDWTRLMDGSTALLFDFYANNASVVKDFGAGNTKVINNASTYIYCTASGCTAKYINISGSNDNSSWTALDNHVTTNATANKWENYTFTNANAYRYYNWTFNDTLQGGYVHCAMYEIEGREPTFQWSNYTIISTPFVATTNPTKGRLVTFIENTSAWTVNTDINASISNNNGTNWDAVTLLNDGTWGANKTILSCNSTNFTGTDNDVIYKIEVSGNKRMFIHGTGGNINATF